MGNRFGSYIRHIRQQQGISLRMVHAQTGISQSGLSLIEAGKHEPAMAIAFKLTTELGGSFSLALRLLVEDAGIPEEALTGQGVEQPSDEHTSPCCR